jgi:hypothetical protein
LQCAERAFHIHLEIVLGIHDGWHEIGSAGQMEKPVAIRQGKVRLGDEADVFFNETKGAALAGGIQIFQPSGAEIINPENLVPIGKKGVHEVAADKT